MGKLRNKKLYDREFKLNALKLLEKGEVSTILDPELHTVDFEYDLMGRVTRKIFEKNTIDQRIVEYVYDAGGNVLAITPAGRPAHNFYYDSVDLPYIYNAPEVAQLLPEEVRTQYSYNLDRQLENIIKPDGTIIHYTYELTKEGYSESTGKLQKITVPERGDILYAYETTKGKKLSTLTTPEGNVLSYTYNGALMESESWSGAVTGTVSRTYNNDFRTTAVTTGGITAGYTYDNDGLLLTAGDMTITRDTESGMVTGTALDYITATQTYNQFGEIETFDAGDYSYDIISRDKLGRITEKQETVEGVTTTHQYTYDPAGRLETVWENGLFVSQYTYDSNGNRLTHNATAATYNDQDMMLSYGDNSYTYTANGDLMVKTGTEGTTTYDYDATGNLNSVTMPTKTVSYVYDGVNRRIAKSVDGTVTEKFIYLSQLKPVAKLNPNDTVFETYVYGTISDDHDSKQGMKINVPEYVIRSGNKYRIITDHLGSVRLVVEASTGAVKQRMSFDEFGVVTEDYIESGFEPLPFGYAGGLYDRDTKLVTFGVREYDSTTGRWMEKEPLGFKGSDNFYAYCNGDPVNYIDINGKFGFLATVILAGGGISLVVAGAVIAIENCVKECVGAVNNECVKKGTVTTPGTIEGMCKSYCGLLTGIAVSVTGIEDAVILAMQKAVEDKQSDPTQDINDLLKEALNGEE